MKKDFISVSGKKYDGMMGRCYRKKDISYKNYGAKGIAVCEAWIKDINEFRRWLLNELFNKDISLEKFVVNSSTFQLDRVDNTGHYTPDNCRIVSPQKNSRNKKGVMKMVKSAEGTIVRLGIILLAVVSIASGNCGNNNGNGNGCSGNTTSGPIGPQGPAGPQGSTGPQGLTGLSGTTGAVGPQGVAGLNGTNAVDQSRFLGELDLRLWDTKRTSFYAFDSYGFNDAPGNDVLMDGRNAFYGFKFVVKLGSSYEERMLDKQAGQIKALEAALAKLSK